MSIGGISGSRYESLRTQFESFRSGNSKLQKSDLEELQTALSSEGTSGSASNTGIDELIENFSKIDTNGDGISSEELDSAAQSGVVSAPSRPEGGPGKMKGPPPGPPPGGGMGGPGGAGGPGGTKGSERTEEQGAQSGTAQSDLLGYSLYEEFIRKIQEQAGSVSSSSSNDDAESLTGSLSSLIDALSEANGSSEAVSDENASTSLSTGEADALARMLNQQIMQAYGRNTSLKQMTVSSLLGEGVTA